MKAMGALVCVFFLIKEISQIQQRIGAQVHYSHGNGDFYVKVSGATRATEIKHV